MVNIYFLIVIMETPFTITENPQVNIQSFLDISIEHLLYLLYAVAYSTEGTVTKGTVKRYFKKISKNDKKSYEYLCQEDLIKPINKHRFLITEKANETLVFGLLNSDYQFTSHKSPKILNTLLTCLKIAGSKTKDFEQLLDNIDFDTFENKFKQFYIELRKQQQLQGEVVVIKKRSIYQKFSEKKLISEKKFDDYYKMLKQSGKIMIASGRDDDLINWAG